jgi:hypothetical protein
VSLNNLAGLYESRRMPRQAEPLYRRSLEIHESVLGPGHPDVAVCLDNLADLLRKMDRGDEARVMEQRARKIRRED